AGRGALIDLPGSLDDRTARRLVRVLAGEGGETEVAVRPDGCFARRLVRTVPQRGTGWRTHGTALITGADTELGADTARWLADAGAGHLLLLTADAPADDPAADPAADLADAGVSVSRSTVDPADSDALTALVAELPAGHPLTVVVHLAPALGRDGTDPVGAARNLCGLALDHDLVAFVLCSCAEGILGGSPAHAHLDALTQQLRARGVPATSLSWGPVDEPDRAHPYGMNAISSRSAGAMLRQAVEQQTATAVLADIDWQEFSMSSEPGRTQLFDDVPEFEPDPTAEFTDEDPGLDGTALRESLSEAGPEERAQILRDTVCEQAARILSVEVDDDTDFLANGLTSLKALELNRNLMALTNVEIPLVAIIEYPNPTQLAEYLVEAYTEAL
ncbi:MAG: beta-ketoacyl reductase, partial [Streptosporangiaceae bacterium]